MRRIYSILFLLTSQSVLLGQGTLPEAARVLSVTRSDGTTEKYVAKWTGTVDSGRWESGGPAVPLQAKFLDDRQCHWTISARIVRRIYLENADGELFESKDSAVPLSVDLAGDGAELNLSTLSGENCGQAEGSYRRDIDRAQQRVRDRFEEIVSADLETVKRLMKSWDDVTEVESR
jgi:hypothetical protein